MEDSKNNTCSDLQSQLRMFGQGLQVLFETVESNFLELEHKLINIKDSNPIHNCQKSIDSELNNE